MKETFPVLPYGFPAAVVGVIVFAIASTRSEALAWALLLGGIALWFGVKRWLRARQASVGIDGVAGGPRNWVELVDRSDDPLAVAQASATGLGNFVGLDEAGNAAFSEPEQSTLVIGPPRSGKTSGLVVPMLLTHNGPAVVTSTKDEVARITSMARYRRGRVLLFDLSGEAGMQLPAQMEPLRWSPLQSASRGWLDAVKMARAMTEASVRRSGVEDASYWTQRAAQLLAALLYAASRPQPTTGKPADMGDVVGWVATSDLEAAADALIAAGRHDDDARRAARQLESIQAAPDKERGSIVSTCYSTIEAYNSAGALRMSTDPTFDPAAFVASHGDTIYVTATSEDQAALAPLVVGLLQDVRRATFARARIRDLHAAGAVAD
jgi:type IV secretory pathway TraG/TraD family ATPase VirD4